MAHWAKANGSKRAQPLLSCTGGRGACFDFLSSIMNCFFPHNCIFLTMYFSSSLLSLTVHFSKHKECPGLGPQTPFWLQLCRRWTVSIQVVFQISSPHCHYLLRSPNRAAPGALSTLAPLKGTWLESPLFWVLKLPGYYEGIEFWGTACASRY